MRVALVLALSMAWVVGALAPASAYAVEWRKHHRRPVWLSGQFWFMLYCGWAIGWMWESAREHREAHQRSVATDGR